MPVWLFLMLFGLSGSVAGGWVALNIRGAADAMTASQQRGHDLRAAATGNFSPPVSWVTAFGFRAIGAAIGLAGLVLFLGGILELLTNG
ncbi:MULTISPECIES: hypothetical protein [unclassified Streptomyces]|jgi:hypothetical protein|uniref:hypothetical protein n=1 Tax=unclassified Streptomyces TaxID=2593676 RepID=UPI002E25DF5A